MTETPPEPAIEPTAEDLAVNLATQFEGFSATPYPDPGTGGAPWTIGYGSTHDDKGNPITPDHAPITEETAREWMVEDMKLALSDIQEHVTVPLTAEETAACEDFIYNCGVGNFNNSTLVRLLNQGKYEAAAEEFPKWDLSNGRILAGLVRRRAAEEALFKSGPEA